MSGTRIYLGILGGVVEVIYSDGSSWGMGGSNGNAAFTAELPRGEQIRYVPQGATSHAPMGWRLLSQFVIIKN